MELSARYLSFDGRPFRLRVGLRPLESYAWLEVDESYDAELAEKARLLRERHDEVVAVVDDGSLRALADRACAEVVNLVVDHLRADHPGIVSERGAPLANRRTGEALEGLHPIDAAGRLVQEDLVVLVPSNRGLVLAAASLCFPSRWRLRDKVGLPMAAIHEPVPGYAESLGVPTDGALTRLAVADADRPVWRLNWSLHDDPALFQPEGHGRGTSVGSRVTPENAGEAVWLRVERQVLRGLPESGGVLFTIRTLQWPLGELVSMPGACADLASTLRTLPPGFATYKSLPAITPAVLEWLDARA